MVIYLVICNGTSASKRSLTLGNSNGAKYKICYCKCLIQCDCKASEYSHAARIPTTMKLSFTLALAGATTAACDAGQPVKVPPTKPGGAAVVPKDFVGFGMESAFFNNFDNDFSENLVSSLASRMSAPPVLRVGGTSGDYFTFDPSQKEARVCVKGPCSSSGGKFSLGPSFFKSYQRFQDARTTIQAPLENPLNTTNTLDYVWQAWNNLGNGKRAASIALGNEVEYIYKEVKPYVNAALSLQNSIVKNLSLSGDAAKIFEVGNTASGSVSNHKLYQV